MNLQLKNDMEKKRILTFSLNFRPFIGGAEVALEEITKKLSSYEFDIVTLRLDKSLPKEEVAGNIHIYRVGYVGFTPLKSRFRIPFIIKLNKFLFPLFGFFKAVSLQRKRKYSAIWVIVAGFAGFAALFFKIMHPKIPYVLTLQEGDSIPDIRRRARLIYPLWRFIFLKADIIQAISSYLTQLPHGLGYIKEVVVVPNGVDLNSFVKRENFEFAEKVKNTTLITTSRLVPKNGVADIIKSLEYLPKEVSLKIVGDGPLRESLEMLVKEKGLESRVSFLGFLLPQDLPKLLSEADIFVRPSLSEGFGNSFIEAMAMGLPVIATPVGGITDFLYDADVNPEKEPTGLYAEVQNPKSIAEKVTLIMNDFELKNRIVTNAGRMVRERYDWNIVAQNMDQKVFKVVIK